MSRFNQADIQEKKKRAEQITMLTAYDYPLAEIIDKAGVDIILIGDSLANVVLGLDDTKKVTMAEMLHHARAVSRAVNRAMVIGDMPYNSYQEDPSRAVVNARMFTGEAGCDGVKVEWFDGCPAVVRRIVESGIPVMGHVGLTPQSADRRGGFKVQGREAEAALKIIGQARSLEEAGCFSLVIECIPDRIAGLITRRLGVPTIGIGAGVHCDGQVLVIHDLLGLSGEFHPKFTKAYVDLRHHIRKAVRRYCADVRFKRFPGKEHSYSIKKEEFDKINHLLKKA